MAKVWQPRTKAPTEKDLYYKRKDKGGYNGFTTYNMFATNGNCTSYAWGRFMEIGSIFSKGIVQKTCELPLNNAEDWFNTCTAYEKGQTPKNGAVACWSKGKKQNSKDGAGHVVIVETFDDKYIYCTESGYNHYMWKSTKYPLKNGKPQLTGYTFEGYIYNPWANNNWKETAPAPTTYNGKVTATNGLNVRKGASTAYGIVKVLKYGSTVTVYETKGKFGRIGVNQWVCLDYIKKG